MWLWLLQLFSKPKTGNIESIINFFPDLSKEQIRQFEMLGPLYKDWNDKINVISRKDIDNLYTNHVLHSLAIARFINFAPGSRILDLGTGGGFPGIPLSIFFPQCNFTLIDGTRKKISVVQDIIKKLHLDNATALHHRAEEHNHKYDFVVVRAVASIDKLFAYSGSLFSSKQINPIPNGILALKGGDLKSELSTLQDTYIDLLPLSKLFDEEYFPDKYLVYVQA